MATYQVMYWKDFPAQVKAWDDAGKARVMLPDRFSQAIDAAAMAEGSAGSEAYLDGWSWGDEHERSGNPQEVADLVASELDQAYPQERLTGMIKERRA